jgi:hypothetical protein
LREREREREINFYLFLSIQRDSLIKNEFSSNIKLLQSYPEIDVQLVINKAKNIRN